MRTIRIIEHISLDGVIQAPGGPGEDGDYRHGGWTVPFADPAVGGAILAAHAGPFDLVLGRRTYDIWAGYWPKARGPFAAVFMRPRSTSRRTGRSVSGGARPSILARTLWKVFGASSRWAALT